MKEIRIHGRGGQGGVMIVRMLAAAMVLEGKWASGFPSFGMERRGAPIVAFARFDDKPIWEKSRVYNPDYLVVIDSGLISSPVLFDGINPDCTLVLNAHEPVKKQFHKNIRLIGSVDATKIGLEEVGIAVTNTPMLGAFASTTGLVQLDSLLSILGDYFTGSKLEQNRKCVERGFKEAESVRF